MNGNKIFESMENLSDDIINEALDYDLVASSRKRPAVRLSAAVLAAVITVIAVTCVVNAEGISDIIKTLFQREKELVDPYSQSLNEENKTEGITLSVSKIFRDGDFIYLDYELHSSEPFEPGVLFYDSMELYCYDETNIYTGLDRCAMAVAGSENANLALLSGVYISAIDEPTCDIKGTVEMSNSRYLSTYVGDDPDYASRLKDMPDDEKEEYIWNLFKNVVTEEKPWVSGKYKFIISGLSNAITDQDGKTITKRYAKEIDVDFDLVTVDERLEELPKTTYHPDSEFIVDGHTFKLTEVTFSSLHMWGTIKDVTGETIEFASEHFPAVEMFSNLQHSLEYPYAYHTAQEWKERYESRYSDYDSYIKNTWCIGVELMYNSEVKYREISGAGALRMYDDPNTDTVQFIISFEAPVYPEDIKSLYVFNSSEGRRLMEENPEIERHNIVIWENPKA